MTKKIIRGILIIAILATFGVIFMFSSQNGDESKGISRKVSKDVINMTSENTIRKEKNENEVTGQQENKKTNEQENNESNKQNNNKPVKHENDKKQNQEDKKLEDVERVIRKLAHFSIYTLLGLLVMAFTYTYDIDIKKRAKIALLVGFLYACSDEFHQLFVEGRSGEIRDVLIDTSGVLVGIVICNVIYKIWSKHNDKKQNDA